MKVNDKQCNPGIYRRIRIVGVMVLMHVICCAAVAQSTAGNKCGTAEHFRSRSLQGPDGRIARAAERPELQTSILSPSKKFRLHFDTTGVNRPALVTTEGARIPGTERAFIDSVGRIFDSVWRIEVDVFGFPAPMADNGAGGGDEYDVYIYRLESSSAYGFTDWNDEDRLPGAFSIPRSATHINIQNDFGSLPTKGMAGLMATAAHEFHHAIQISSYGEWNREEWYFYELSAEAMEPMVFPAVKDYIRDIGPYFNRIETYSLFTLYDIDNFSTTGYERAIWGIFLMQQYGVRIMREMWEAVATMKPALAMKTVLEKNGTSLSREFSEFCYRNYFTGWRADPARSYTDARLFPMVHLLETQHLDASTLFQKHCNSFGVNYLQAAKGTDTAGFIIVNTDLDDALGSGTAPNGYSLNVSPSPIGGGTQMKDGWWSSFSVSDPSNWKLMAVWNGVPWPATDVLVCFPNPFTPGRSPLFITAQNASLSSLTSRLHIYSSSNRLIFSGDVPIQLYNGSAYAAWDGRGANGEFVPSGVYIYVLPDGDRTVKGKFAVVR